MSQPCIVSSPGKILVAGGYLVLDPVYSGAVVGSGAKFVVGIHPDAAADNTITVVSCQFQDAPWVYRVDGSRVTPRENQAKNPFLDTAIPIVYKYLKGCGVSAERLRRGIKVYCFSDNDFYSQVDRLKEAGLSADLDGLSQLEPCGILPTTLSRVAKTGLGSSATLVTSLVGALLAHFLDLDDLSGHKLVIHNLAQLSHSVAQGKLGSGFDVSAAAFGNQIYKTFQSDWLKGWVQEYDQLNPKDFYETVNRQDVWDTKVTPFQLPPDIHLSLADIQHGSHTPSMVSKLLRWRREHPAVANPIWEDLNAQNEKFVELLNHLSNLYTNDKLAYSKTMSWIRDKRYVEWISGFDQGLNADVITTLTQVRETFAKIRAHFRTLSQAADVPIEPTTQTQLLDTMEAAEGVLVAGVPGAGGFDAVFALTVTDAPLRGLQQLWRDNNVIPLLRGGAQSGDGVQLEGQNTVYWHRFQQFCKDFETRCKL